MSENILDYLKENRNKNLSELYDYLKIPSVSTDYEYKEDVKRASKYIYNYLNNISISNLEVIKQKNTQLFTLNIWKLLYMLQHSCYMVIMMFNQQILMKNG